MTVMTDPHPPNLLLLHPYTILSIPHRSNADAHITHGSQVTYNTHSFMLIPFSTNWSIHNNSACLVPYNCQFPDFLGERGVTNVLEFFWMITSGSNDFIVMDDRATNWNFIRFECFISLRCQFIISDWWRIQTASKALFIAMRSTLVIWLCLMWEI